MSTGLERQREEDEERKSRIESARDSLYKPGGPSVIKRHDDDHLPQEEETPPPVAWTPPPVPRSFDKEKFSAKANMLFRRLLIAAVIFFVISLGVAAFMYFYGNTTISARNIRVEVDAPPSVPSSDTFSFAISVENNNNSALVKSAIVIDYPEGARYVDDSTKPLVSERIEIGTLEKGMIVKKNVSARLFGEENAEKNIRVRFEYQVDDSNAHFSKDEEFNVVLRLAPVVLSITALKEINNNQEVTLVARVVSNSNNTLSNVALNVTYPFGFAYTSSNLEVEGGKRGEFPIGVLMPNETKTVEIKGMINGQSAEEKIFKFNVGTASPDNDARVTTSLATFIHDMIIRGDFLATSIVFNDRNGYATLGIPIRGSIQWKNTLSVPINDAEFTLEIDGDLIDLDNISSDRGFYDSNRGIIEWNKGVDEDLEEIAPGDTGSFAFTISLLTNEEALENRITNPKINLNFDVHGRRITDRDVTEDIESSFVRVVPIVSTVELDAKSLHGTGPLKNTGPVPPKAENKTTYTVALSLTNAVNEITGGDLTASLPNYVKYEGETTPSGDKVSWNENTRQLRWTVGTLPVRTGFGATPRTLYFKVSVTPSRTQINQVLPLVNNISFTGRDEFADADIKASGDTVTTLLQDANGFGNGQVVQ